MHLISFLQGNQLFCIFLRDEKTDVQRLSISNWQIWAQTLSQNDPRAGIQAEIFKDSEIPTDGFLDLLNIGHIARVWPLEYKPLGPNFSSATLSCVP